MQANRWHACLGALLWTLGARAQAPDPVATVNGQPVSRAQFQSNLEQRGGAAQLQTCILANLITAEATRLKVWPNDAEVAGWLAWFKREQFSGRDAAYRTWLAETGRDEAALLAEMRLQAAQFALRTRGARYTDNDLRTYYEKNREVYGKPEVIVYRQVIVPWPKFPPRATPETQRQLSRAAADELLAQLKAGADGETIARTTSVDPAARRNGGRVATPTAFLRDENNQPFLDVLLGLKDNAWAEAPLWRGNRWVLVQRLELQPALVADFATLRTQVVVFYLLDTEGAVQSQEEFVAGLLKGADIKIADPRYAALKLRATWVGPCGLVLPGWLRDQ